MLERCPDARPKFTATLPNYRLIFAGYSRVWRGGVASVKRSKGDKVVGAVYEISERCLRSLDKCEGYPGTYDRTDVLVFPDLGDSIRSVAYVKVEQSEETQASREYLATIQQGCKDWGIV